MAWLQFTEGENNTPLLVNTDHLECVRPSLKGGSCLNVHTSSGHENFYVVNQTLEEVFGMLAEAEGF